MDDLIKKISKNIKKQLVTTICYQEQLNVARNACNVTRNYKIVRNQKQLNVARNI